MSEDHLWFVRPKPQPDEILSSWLVRLAWSQGLKLESFCYRSWGRGAQVMAGDVDLFARDEILETLNVCTGTPRGQVENTTFRPYEGILFNTLTKHGANSWISFLGNRNQIIRERGFSYCPDCLRTDEIPYFRRSWRLAFVTTCLVHRRHLTDKCPYCNSLVVFDRWDKQTVNLPEGDPILNCHCCKQNRADNIDINEKPSELLLDFQWVLERTLSRGWMNINGKPVDAFLVFKGLRMLTGLFLDRRRTNRVLNEFRDLGFFEEFDQFLTRNRRFESLPIGVRYKIMNLIAWLIQDWPNRFVAICEKRRFSSSYLFDQGKNRVSEIPFWLWEPIHQHLNFKFYAPSSAEIQSAVNFLIRTKGTFRKGDLASTLGVSWLNKRVLNQYATLFSK